MCIRDRYSGLKGKFKGWETANCGTVHKFQGKEAEEVIFLLGCQPSSTGAIGWVNSNILNVAVTRAKKRVYFIGDYEVWSRQNRNFSPEIICFSEEDTGLQRIHFSELPDFGEIEAMEDVYKRQPIYLSMERESRLSPTNTFWLKPDTCKMCIRDRAIGWKKCS